jgi:hypothetical protein
MHILRVIPILSFLLLSSGPILLTSGQAYGWGCCGCGSTTCYMCTCRGTPGCPYCGADDSDIVQSTALLGSVAVELRNVPLSLTTLFLKSDSSNRLMWVAGSENCVQPNFRLNFINSSHEMLTLEEVLLKDREFTKYITASK